MATLRPTSLVLASVLSFLSIARLSKVQAKPWNLRDYELCSSHRLEGIRAEASGATYNPITNSIWVITRSPAVIGEYSMSGRLIRTISHKDAKFRDPEGITWMYDYTYAVSQEGTPDGYDQSSVSIVEAAPWQDEVKEIKRIIVRDIRQSRNAGLESVTWDADEEKLLAGQEMKPMQLWEIDPRDGRSRKTYDDFDRDSRFRDLGGIYKRKGDDGLYVLSEPTKTVLHIESRGNRIDDQYRTVQGRLPEGLTFTPDGEMMIIAGEPNELFIYTSTGECDYEPGKFDRPSESENEKSSEENGSDESTPTPTSGDESEANAEKASSNWFLDPTQGFCSYNNACARIHSNKWCANSTSNCLGCHGTWCPKAGVDGDPITEQPDVEKLLTENTDELVDGFMALMDVLLDGVTQIDLQNNEQLQKAVSSAVFGDPDAHVVLVIEPAPESMSRRLMEAESLHSSVTIKILGETRYHAEYLGKRLNDAISSGTLLNDLRQEGLGSLKNISVSQHNVVHAGMSPDRYPKVYRDSKPEDTVPEVTAYIGVDDVVRACIIGATAFAVVACAVLLGVYVWLRRRRERSLVVAVSEDSELLKNCKDLTASELDKNGLAEQVSSFTTPMKLLERREYSEDSPLIHSNCYTECVHQTFTPYTLVDIPGTSNMEIDDGHHVDASDEEV